MNARLLSIAATLLLLGVSSLATAAGWTFGEPGHDAKLLPADQAFQLLPPQRRNDRVQLEWTIAPGYFLYRDRIHVESANGDPAAGTLNLPPAQSFDEAGLGTVRIYRGDLQASLQLAPGAAPQRLRVRFQGCSDKGVCYPPQTRVVNIPPERP